MPTLSLGRMMFRALRSTVSIFIEQIGGNYSIQLGARAVIMWNGVEKASTVGGQRIVPTLYTKSGPRKPTVIKPFGSE